MTYWLESFQRASERGRIDVGARKSARSKVTAMRKRFEKSMGMKRLVAERKVSQRRMLRRIERAFGKPIEQSSPSPEEGTT